MAKGKTSKQHNVGHANHASNRIMKIKREIKKAEKKMEKLLQLFKKNKQRDCGDTIRKVQGIKEGSKRHINLQEHISTLKGLLKK